MTVITTIDAMGVTPEEYRAILDEMGVEARPEPGIYLHLTVPIEDGYRIVEVWDRKESFDAFVQNRMAPAAERIGLRREMKITVEPLYNIFVPRLQELTALADTAPGGPLAAHVLT